MTHYIDPTAKVYNHTDALNNNAVAGGSVTAIGVTIGWQSEALLDPNANPPGPGDGTNITNRDGLTIRDGVLACKLRAKHLGVAQGVLDGFDALIAALPENR